MSALGLLFAVVFGVLEFLAASASISPTEVDGKTAHSTVTDLTIHLCSSTDLVSSSTPDSGRWHRLEKDLYLHTSQESAWLHIASVEEKDLSNDDLVVLDIKVSEQRPVIGSKDAWESRSGSIWILRTKYTNSSHQPVTGVNVLFGADAVDPNPVAPAAQRSDKGAGSETKCTTW